MYTQQTNSIPGVTEYAPVGFKEEMPEVKAVVFKLKVNRRGRVHVPGVDDVTNPKTGKPERVRLLNGVDTIWVKEQKHLDKDYINQNMRSLTFERKTCRILETDVTALEFARICNSNIGNKKRIRATNFEFFEYDGAAQEKAAEAREMLQIEMAIEAKGLPEEKLKRIASFVHIPMFDPETGMPVGVEGIRAKTIIFAKNHPEKFKELLEDKTVEVQFLVKKAIAESKIDTTNATAKWATGGAITKVPSGRKAVEYLTELAMTNSSEGKKFLEQLNEISK